MRRLFAIGMLLAVALLTGCGTDYKLPTESPKGRAVPSDGSYQMLSTWTGMNDVQDILLTQGSSSQLFILFNHGGSGTTSRGEVRAYALTRPEVLAGYDFHVPADTPFNPVALASGGDGIAASANNRIYVLSRGDTCLARQNPNTGNCSDTTGGFRNKVTHLEYYWRVFEYRLLAGDTISSFTDTTMAYVSGVAADAMGQSTLAASRSCPCRVRSTRRSASVCTSRASTATCTAARIRTCPVPTGIAITAGRSRKAPASARCRIRTACSGVPQARSAIRRSTRRTSARTGSRS